MVNGQNNNNTEADAPQKRCLAGWILPIVCQIFIGAVHDRLHQLRPSNITEEAPVTSSPITQAQPSFNEYGNSIRSYPAEGNYGITTEPSRQYAVRGTNGSNKCGNKVPASQYGCPKGYYSDMNGCCDSS